MAGNKIKEEAIHKIFMGILETAAIAKGDFASGSHAVASQKKAPILKQIPKKTPLQNKQQNKRT